jgi:hypothetical protein
VSSPLVDQHWDAIIVDDLDYTPLLALPRLKSVRVMNAHGMTPTHEQLKAALPWSG